MDEYINSELRKRAGILTAAGLFIFIFFLTGQSVQEKSVEKACVLVSANGKLALSPDGGVPDDVEVHNDNYRLAPFFFQKIAINKATAELLETIPGIGPSMAEAIILNRQNNGPFLDDSDLTRVRGIGAKKARKFDQYITYE